MPLFLQIHSPQYLQISDPKVLPYIGGGFSLSEDTEPLLRHLKPTGVYLYSDKATPEIAQDLEKIVLQKQKDSQRHPHIGINRFWRNLFR